jgi:two-component system osmolarity sensor histidine kinase EnvZ
MERMIDAYLDFVRGEGREATARSDLGDILKEIGQNVRRSGKKINVEAEGDLSLHLRPVAFGRAINNLVANASKYADEIWIEAVREEEEDVIRLKIHDNGPGIPDNLLEDVFRPFYRVDESRNLSTGGVGLGLPSAQDIILSHGGKISLGRGPHGGLLAEIEIPV